MITYRTALPTDAPALASLRVDFLIEAGNMPPDADRAEMERTLLDFFTRALANGSFVAWLALNGDKIIATSGMSFSSYPPAYGRGGEVVYVSNMYTLPDYRRRGIAEEIFKRLLAEAKTRGCHKLNLYASDMGRPLYEKFGFHGKHSYMEYSL